MARPKSAQRFIRKNITLPDDYEEKLRRLRAASGAVSDSELIRQALLRLEEAMELSSQDKDARERIPDHA